MRTYRPAYRIDGVTHTSRRWWIDLHDHRGVRRRLAGLPDQRATEALGRNIERLVRCVAAGETPDPAMSRWLEALPAKMQTVLTEIGLLERVKAAAFRPLDEHVDGAPDLPGLRQSLEAKGATALYVSVVTARVRRIFEGCEFRSWNDIDPSKVMVFLSGLQAGKKRVGAATFNAYLVALKTFCTWMVHEGRALRSPVDHLEGPNVRVDPRHARRALAIEELRRLLQAARQGPVVLGMSGQARALLYRLAVETGLRASELASLTAASFDLCSPSPTVAVAAAHSKRRRQDVLPLRPDTAIALAEYIKTLPAGDKLFAVPTGRLARMMRVDLAVAGVPYIDATGKHADFHALRHTCGSLLAAAGVHPKVAQTILRHSDINMTLSRYSHVFAGQAAAAVAALPSL
jgi:integrase